MRGGYAPCGRPAASQSPTLLATWRRPAADDRGRLLVLVDETLYPSRIRRAVDDYIKTHPGTSLQPLLQK